MNTEYMASNTGDGIAKPTGGVYGSEGKCEGHSKQHNGIVFGVFSAGE